MRHNTEILLITTFEPDLNQLKQIKKKIRAIYQRPHSCFTHRTISLENKIPTELQRENIVLIISKYRNIFSHRQEIIRGGEKFWIGEQPYFTDAEQISILEKEGEGVFKEIGN